MSTQLPDEFFTLPDFISETEDADLRTMYFVLVDRLKKDAESSELSTIQWLLLERIAFNYVVIRWRERKMGTTQGFEHTKYHKDFNTYWLAMTQEWRRILEGSSTDERISLMGQVGQALSQAFVGLHPDVSGPMRDRIAKAFEESGL